MEGESGSRTQVGIVGAGPAGLVLSHLLQREGIECVVLEDRSRKYVENRVRAEGLVHHGIELRFDGEGHRIAFEELAEGRAITIYGQQEVVKDLIAARLDSGAPLLFEVDDVTLHEIDSDQPSISFKHEGSQKELRCDAIAGCDGFHGISRPSVPDGVLGFNELVYPFAWLGILAQVSPSTEELIYAPHERGFALHSLRSPELSRLYVQCDPDDSLEDWPDERIWEELHLRLARDDGWTLKEGPVIEKSIAPLRSFVAQPMQFGRLYLAVDDVQVLGEALARYLKDRDSALLDAYSDACLRRVWRVQHFSWWMTWMLHRFPDDDGFLRGLRRSQLEYVCSSPVAAATLAENYVGLGRVR